MELHEQVHGVSTRDDLVEFIKSLLEDLRKNPDDWENPTLERYLEALASWTASMDGYYRNRGERVPATPSWRVFGDMLMAAKMYE